MYKVTQSYKIKRFEKRNLVVFLLKQFMNSCLIMSLVMIKMYLNMYNCIRRYQKYLLQVNLLRRVVVSVLCHDRKESNQHLFLECKIVY